MKHISLEQILNEVNSILATQPQLTRFHKEGVVSSSSKEQNGSTNTNSNGNLPPILPPSIPDLPTEAITLPITTPTDPISSITSLLTKHVLPYLNLSSLSPQYYGFVTGGATPAALIADILGSIYDQNCGVHLPLETIATTVEAATLNLLVDLFCLPRAEWGVGNFGGGNGGGGGGGGGGGVITTGATASNILGLALGREFVLGEAIRRRKGGAATAAGDTGMTMSVGTHGLLKVSREAGVDDVVVLSSLPHSSLIKAASILGIGRENVVSVATRDDPLKMDMDVLRTKFASMKDDRVAYILAISAGEVNTARFATGGFEEMKSLRALCDEYGVWIHVDGAFGLFARALMGHSSSSAGEYADLVRGVEGLELADSITGDGHKLLNVPYDCGLAFTRHKKLSELVFSNGNAAYLTSGISDRGDNIQSPSNIGLENSRRFRALPAYATLMAYGKEGYIDMLKRQIGLARKVVEWMYDQPALELLPQSSSKKEAISQTFIGVLFRAKGENLNKVLVKKINQTGMIYVTGTSWGGKPAARIAVSNWQVDVERDSKIIKEMVSSVVAD